MDNDLKLKALTNCFEKSIFNKIKYVLDIDGLINYMNGKINPNKFNDIKTNIDKLIKFPNYNEKIQNFINIEGLNNYQEEYLIFSMSKYIRNKEEYFEYTKNNNIRNIIDKYPNSYIMFQIELTNRTREWMNKWKIPNFTITEKNINLIPPSYPIQNNNNTILFPTQIGKGNAKLNKIQKYTQPKISDKDKKRNALIEIMKTNGIESFQGVINFWNDDVYSEIKNKKLGKDTLELIYLITIYIYISNNRNDYNFPLKDKIRGLKIKKRKYSEVLKIFNKILVNYSPQTFKDLKGILKTLKNQIVID